MVVRAKVIPQEEWNKTVDALFALDDAHPFLSQMAEDSPADGEAEGDGEVQPESR